MEGVLLALDHERVTRVRPAVETRAHLCRLREDVNELSLSLVAPLPTEDDHDLGGAAAHVAPFQEA